MNKENKYEGAKVCYYNDFDSCLYKYFCPKKPVNKSLKLFGLKTDGGYVLTDDFNNIKIAYSFGVNKEYSFEMQLADSGVDSYMYDHTVKNGLNFTKYNLGINKNFSNNIEYYKKKLHFHKIGLASSLNHAYNKKTLEELLKENGHLNETNMILKMDIEGNEFEIIKELSDDILKKFKYITLELHFSGKRNFYIEALKKLSMYHQVIFIRFNDWGNIVTFGYNRFDNAIELTYMIKEGTEFVRDYSIYPLKDFDFKNGGFHKIDFNLNIFKLFYKE